MAELYDHTFTPWKVGDGTRSKTSEANWRKPLKWNRQQQVVLDTMAESREMGLPDPDPLPVRPRVFCASLADVFEEWDGEIHGGGFDDGVLAIDDERTRLLTMADLRRDLFALIDATPNLDYMLLTKRPENIRRMWPDVESTERAVCRKCGKVRRTRNRRSRPGVAISGAPVESLGETHSNNSLQETTGGDEERSGISPGSVNVGVPENQLRGTQTGLAHGGRADSGGNDDQSQEWNQDGQQDRQPRTSHDERTTPPRNRRPECQPASPERVEAPENDIDGIRCSGNATSPEGGGSSEGHRGGLFDATEGGECNCESPHLETHLNYRPNCWIGCSVSDQPAADQMIPELLNCRDLSPVLFVSAEPLLGLVDLRNISHQTAGYDSFGNFWDLNCENHCTWRGFEEELEDEYNCPECGSSWALVERDPDSPGIDFVNVGCESNGRKVGRLPDGGESGYWQAARSLREQCAAAGVAFFHKQGPVNGRVSHDPAEWPEDLSVREMPEPTTAGV